MRTSFYVSSAIRSSLLAVVLLLTPSCSDLLSRKQTGTITVSFNRTEEPFQTKSEDIEALDTEDFILEVTSSSGETLYYGRFGDSPEVFSVSEGSYTISAVSKVFSSPEFSSPVFGDTEIVVVSGGENVNACLTCTQTNSGLKFIVSDSFKNTFDNGMLNLQSEDGSLKYSFEEERTAYFNPGEVSISVLENGKETPLTTKTLKEKEILSLKLSSSSAASNGKVEILVDTLRNYVSEKFDYGSEDGNGDDVETAFTITEARENAPKEDVWVCGYIVGVATGTSKFSFDAPFEKNTNIILGLRSTTTAKEYCLSVELKSGDIRDALNLEDNPELKGRQIYIRGDVVSAYYGIPGLKNITEYQFK